MNSENNRNVICRIWNKHFFFFANECVSVNCDISFSARVARGVSGELGKRDTSYYLARRCAFKLLECEEDAAAYPSPCSQRWKDERRCGSARKRERDKSTLGKSYIKPYPLCSSVIHLSQRPFPPTYGLPSLASISPVRVSTLLYLSVAALFGRMTSRGRRPRLTVS